MMYTRSQITGSVLSAAQDAGAKKACRCFFAIPCETQIAEVLQLLCQRPVLQKWIVGYVDGSAEDSYCIYLKYSNPLVSMTDIAAWFNLRQEDIVSVTVDEKSALSYLESVCRVVLTNFTT